MTYLLPLIIIIPHLLYTLLGPFYIYPEFNLYPYLASRGFTPYTQLIDQHPPLLFFGPLHLGQLSLHHPFTLTLLFAALISVTNFLVFHHLYRSTKSLSYSFLAATAFAAGFLLLDGRFMWIETFILFSLVAYVYFQSIKPKSIFPTLFLSFCVSLKPQLLPLTLLLLFVPTFHKRKLLLLAVFPLIQLAYLLQNNLFWPYLEILRFNSSTYASLASQLPQFNQLIRLVLTLAPLSLLFTSPLTPALLLLGSITAFPRFELYHLLPILIAWVAVVPKRPNSLLLFLSLPFLLIFLLLRHGPWQSRNVFLEPPSPQLTARLDNTSSLFVLGAGDSLYYYTQTLPPGRFYLPQLPWYYQNKGWVDRQLQALTSNPPQIVVVNPAASVDDHSTLVYTAPVWNWVNKNYQKVDSLDGLDIYQAKTYANRN